MTDEGKKTSAIAALALTVGGIVLACRPKPEEPDEGGASMQIRILDSKGNEVPHNSPADLYEGESYTVQVSVTNRSTKAGQPVAVEFTLSHQSTLVVNMTPTSARTDTYGANETKTFNYGLNILDGTAGEFGALYFYLDAPTGERIAAEHEDVSILSHVIAAYITQGQVWDAELNQWKTLDDGVSIPWNQQVVVAPGCINQSDIPISVRINVEIKAPNGSILVSESRATAVMNPMDGVYVDFTPFTSSQEGTYQMSIWLTYDNEQLDSKDISLVCAAEIVYEADLDLEYSYVANSR